MKMYIGACSLATTLFLMGTSFATASSLESIAGAVGGQSSCEHHGPPEQIRSLFGSIFSIGDIGDGISDCGLKGSIQNLITTQGPLTSTNSVSATVGGGLYTGTSSAMSNYGALSVATHGNNLGVSNPYGYSESGGFSIFNDQLTFTSPTQTNGSVGSVVYTFTIDGAMTTPVPSFPSGSENIANLVVHQDSFIQSNVFTAYTISHRTGTILGNPSYPGFTMSEGSVEGSGQFSTVLIPITWGDIENLTVGLAAVSFPATGATLDAHLNGVLSGITVYDDTGHLNSDFKISAASGSVYTANGVSPVPEPQTYALFFTGLVFIGFIASRHANFRIRI